jgi:hypothetical protein
LISQLPLKKCIQIAELINYIDVEINHDYDVELIS